MECWITININNSWIANTLMHFINKFHVYVLSCMWQILDVVAGQQAMKQYNHVSTFYSVTQQDIDWWFNKQFSRKP